MSYDMSETQFTVKMGKSVLIDLGVKGLEDLEMAHSTKTIGVSQNSLCSA